MVDSVATVGDALLAHDYLADDGLATAIFLALSLERPLLLEGEAGVGKTEVAKVLARWRGTDLLRLQCYEGIDAAQALYEWDYARQLLHLRAIEAAGGPVDEDELYTERFLVRRPLLQAIDHGGTPPVLLIDEIDRADDEFEAFLLELLSEFAVTIPELGEIRAVTPPVVVLTSNRTRDVHDALKRRCLYHWIDHPDFDREVAIVERKAPGVSRELARDVAGAAEVLRSLDLYKPPGVAETIDWATALQRLGVARLDETAVTSTIGVVLKYREDQARLAEPGVAATIVAGGARAVPEPAPGFDPARAAVGFARCLRAAGLRVPTGSTVMFAEALAVLGWDRGDDVYWGARATLCRRPEDVERFDECFGAWFASLGERAVADSGTMPIEAIAAFDAPVGADADDEEHPDAAVPILTVRFSRAESLRHRDFATYTAAEHDEARQVLADLRVSGARRRSRRLTRGRRAHPRPDLRRTMRAALQTDGEPFTRAWRSPSRRPRRLVVLCDVSGSMEPYARVLVRFLHSAVVARTHVEAFAFGTRLTRITRELSNRDPDAAIAAAALRVVDWSGGTRIGAAIRSFNDTWGMRGMARGAVVVIISDGWDRGEPEVLAEQMARLARVAHRIIWVNPLKASPGFAPLAAGMAAALPSVDDFVEGHSIASLADLAALVDAVPA